VSLATAGAADFSRDPSRVVQFIGGLVLVGQIATEKGTCQVPMGNQKASARGNEGGRHSGERLRVPPWQLLARELQLVLICGAKSARGKDLMTASPFLIL
jgi:hypothetical protein